MRLPTIQGIIRRRILANFRIDPVVIQRQIPSRFRPKLHNGFAVAGVCLIRLENIRPKPFPNILGFNSENAAHRVAVLWDGEEQTHEGVFISRRDTNSEVAHLAGGHIFPGEHCRAVFDVADTGSEITFSMKSIDTKVAVEIEAEVGGELPSNSIFSSLEEASSFFEAGSVGYSVTRDLNRLDGLKLETRAWRVEPLHVKNIFSSYFADKGKFPTGSIEFDHALIMRNISHEWHSADDLYV